MSRPNLKFKSFSEGWGSRPNLKFKIFGEGCGVSHLCMSRLNPKFKIFSVGGGSVIIPYLGKIWNLKFSVRVWGSVIFSCPGQFFKFILFGEIRGQSSFHVQTQSEIQNFGEVRVSHLSMSKQNLKFKDFVEDGDHPSFYVQAKSEI